MSALLKLDNFSSSNIREKTYVDADYESGTSLVVKSGQNIVSNLYALIGLAGQEQTEIALIDSVASNTLTLHATLSNAHAKYSDVTILLANQIQVYRAANVNGTAPADSDFSVFGSPVNINSESLMTTYADPAGGSDYWYKYTYINEATDDETSLSDSLAVRGGDGAHYASLDAIRQEAGLNNNNYVADSLISEKRAAAEDEINGLLAGTFTVPFASVPPMITQITEELAAGMLLTIEYGPFASGTNKDGNAKLENARAKLSRLKDQSLPLVDGTGTPIPGSGSRVGGWPDDSTRYARPEDDGGERLHRITDEY